MTQPLEDMALHYYEVLYVQTGRKGRIERVEVADTEDRTRTYLLEATAENYSGPLSEGELVLVLRKNYRVVGAVDAAAGRPIADYSNRPGLLTPEEKEEARGMLYEFEVHKDLPPT